MFFVICKIDFVNLYFRTSNTSNFHYIHWMDEGRSEMGPERKKFLFQFLNIWIALKYKCLEIICV